MTIRNYTQFFHRYNQDNTVDVICSECFQTIGTQIRTENALRCEREHICSVRLTAVWLANHPNAALSAH